MKIVTLLGPPGCGKGTQAKKLATEFGLVHISTGDIFRSMVISGTDDLARQIRTLIDAGQLVPDELTISILEAAVQKNPSKKGYIFDGFPRTLQQYGIFTSLLEEQFPTANKQYLYFSVSERELMHRLLQRAVVERRKDDNRKTIKDRLSVYHAQTSPIVEILHRKGALCTIYGTGKTIPEVWDQVKKFI